MTPYKNVYSRFLQKVTDYQMMTLSEEDLSSLWLGWLHAAVAKQKVFDHELTLDDVAQEFTEDLSDLEMEILAVGMVQEWLEPQLNSIALTKQFIGTSEEKLYSQANHESELRNLRHQLKRERKKLIRDYQYDNFARNGA